MKKRGKSNVGRKSLYGVLTVLLISAVTFLTIKYGPGLTGNTIFDSAKNIVTGMSPTLRYIIIGEWLIIILIAAFILIKNRINASEDKRITQELLEVKTRIQQAKQKPETDIDVLYKLLQQMKILRLTAVKQLFGIRKDLALEWAKVLEESKLALIHYPTFGDPKLILNEAMVAVQNEKSK